MSAPKSESRFYFSAGILIFGAVAYAFLCLPAIRQRGYPPIDPIWMGVTYLWIVPVCLAAVFDSRSFQQRRYMLGLYAWFTGFIANGTVVMIVPHRVSILGMLLFSPFYGVFHFFVIAVVDWLMQRTLGWTRTTPNSESATHGYPRFSLASWMLGITILCLGFGFPVAYRNNVINSSRSRGISVAEQHWQAGKAIVFRKWKEPVQIGNVAIEYDVDPQTGLEREHTMSDLGWSAAYNKRVEELIHKQGLPKNSLKSILPPPEEIVALFQAVDFEEVKTFPHDLTPEITLMRSGSITRGNRTMSATGNDLNIITTNGMCGFGGGIKRVEVRLDDQLVFIRNGPDYIIILHRDGRRICRASRW